MSDSETSSETDEQSASATTTDDAGSNQVQRSVAALLREKLEASGQLNELKAQLRAAAYQALNSSEHMPNVASSSSNVGRLRRSEYGRLTLWLIDNALERLHLHATRGTYRLECNAQQDEGVNFESKIAELIGPFHDDGETPIILQVLNQAEKRLSSSEAKKNRRHNENNGTPLTAPSLQSTLNKTDKSAVGTNKNTTNAVSSWRAATTAVIAQKTLSDGAEPSKLPTTTPADKATSSAVDSKDSVSSVEDAFAPVVRRQPSATTSGSQKGTTGDAFPPVAGQPSLVTQQRSFDLTKLFGDTAVADVSESSSSDADVSIDNVLKSGATTVAKSTTTKTNTTSTSITTTASATTASATASKATIATPAPVSVFKSSTTTAPQTSQADDVEDIAEVVEELEAISAASDNSLESL